MKPTQKSAPTVCSSLPAESDPSVTTDFVGADTPSSVSTPAQDATALADRQTARIAFLSAYCPGWDQDENTNFIQGLKAAFNAGYALRATSQTPDAVREALDRIVISFQAQADRYSKNCDDPKFNECQKEIWASLANEKLDDLRILRKALQQSPATDGPAK